MRGKGSSLAPRQHPRIEGRKRGQPRSRHRWSQDVANSMAFWRILEQVLLEGGLQQLQPLEKDDGRCSPLASEGFPCLALRVPCDNHIFFQLIRKRIPSPTLSRHPCGKKSSFLSSQCSSLGPVFKASPSQRNSRCI